MFEAITRLFTQAEPKSSGPLEPRLAVAALLVHLAAVDGAVKREERQAIEAALKAHYGLKDQDVEKLIAEATRRDADAVDFYKFTSALSALEAQDRIEIVRMMWQVVYADQDNHELEDNMVWRIAELIGVSSRDRTVLRNKVRKQG